MAGGGTSRGFESRVRTVPAVAEVRGGLGLRNEAVALSDARRGIAGGTLRLGKCLCEPRLQLLLSGSR
jgi:hypothetical protein